MPEQTIIDLRMLPQVSNTAFFPLFLCKDRYLEMLGGAGSGKSVFAATKIIVRIIKASSEGRTHKFLCLRKTQPAARRSILALFEWIINSWRLSGYAKINKTDMTIFILGSEIIITGMDDREKIKSIHGITGVWLEEATEFSYDDFKHIDLRLRGITKDYKQIISTHNPIDEQHWIRQKLFTDKLQAELEAGIVSGNRFVRRVFTSEVDGKEISYAMTVMHSTYKDNQFIDPEYKAQLEMYIDLDPNYHRIYTLGLWGVLEGLIFDRWEVTKTWPEKFDTGGFGLDFGYSIDEAAIAEVGFIGNNLYLRERLYKTNQTNPDLARELKGILKDSENQFVVADNAEPKSITEIRQTGIQIVPCVKGKDSINHGIQRIKQYNLYIDYNSPNLIKELQTHKWAMNKDGSRKSPPKPLDLNNHLIAAIRYIVTKIKGTVKIGLDILDTEPEHKTFFDESGFKVHDEAPTINIDDPDIWNDI